MSLFAISLPLSAQSLRLACVSCVSSWRDLFAPTSVIPLVDLLVVSLYRTEGDDQAPSPTACLSRSTTLVHVKPFDSAAAADYISQCLHWDSQETSSSYLLDFLTAQSRGSPLFLKSLMLTLANDRVLRFDWESLRWVSSSSRPDGLQVQLAWTSL